MVQTKIDIDYLARLANLTLQPKEKKRLATDLPNILRFIGIIKGIDTKGLAPTFQTIPINNVSHKDIEEPFFSIRQALANAKRINNKYFISRPVF